MSLFQIVTRSRDGIDSQLAWELPSRVSWRNRSPRDGIHSRMVFMKIHFRTKIMDHHKHKISHGKPSTATNHFHIFIKVLSYVTKKITTRGVQIPSLDFPSMTVPTTHPYTTPPMSSIFSTCCMDSKQKTKRHQTIQSSKKIKKNKNHDQIIPFVDVKKRVVSSKPMSVCAPTFDLSNNAQKPLTSAPQHGPRRLEDQTAGGKEEGR